mmetsp:Transcript_24937/g.81440  ORF Transcript_24937/g.81440 Transcript_24937/m.81440 type:complete len:277 (+) Transcript_24937:169-999(+)
MRAASMLAAATGGAPGPGRHTAATALLAPDRGAEQCVLAAGAAAAPGWHHHGAFEPRPPRLDPPEAARLRGALPGRARDLRPRVAAARRCCGRRRGAEGGDAESRRPSHRPGARLPAARCRRKVDLLVGARRRAARGGGVGGGLGGQVGRRLAPFAAPHRGRPGADGGYAALALLLRRDDVARVAPPLPGARRRVRRARRRRPDSWRRRAHAAVAAGAGRRQRQRRAGERGQPWRVHRRARPVPVRGRLASGPLVGLGARLRRLAARQELQRHAAR